MKTQIIFEDKDLLVCHKPAGFPVQTKRVGSMDMESELQNYLYRKEGNGKPYIGIIHRLDQPVEGLLVFAKNPSIAAKLNQQMQKEGFGKYYIAEIEGSMSESSGTLTDYLVKNVKLSRGEIAQKDQKDAKKAVLHFKEIKSFNEGSFLEIQLETGRFHQIRVQLSHQGHPIVGDTKYNSKYQNQRGYHVTHLCAWRLKFKHPRTNKIMEFEICPEWFER